jgi:predicted dehydrogenase
MDDIDAVDICVPHNLHGKMAVSAAEAGKHVLLEKPIATTLSDADKIISASKKTGIKLMIAENVRFVPAHQIAKRLIEDGIIGRVFLTRSHQGGSEIERMMDPKSWKGTYDKCGGGVLIDSGVHRLELFRSLLGEVDSVYAWTAKQVVKLENKAEDNALVLLRFKNGAIGQLDSSWSIMSPWNESIDLYGTDGSMLIDLSKGSPTSIFSKKMRERGWFQPLVEHSPTGWWADSIMREVEAFVDSITEDKEPEVTGEDGRATLEIALAAYESAKTRKETKLPLAP